MKKLWFLALSCVLIISLCGCSKDSGSETAETEYNIVEITNVEELVGDWHDAVSGRASMTAEMSYGQLYFEVMWSDSASEYHEFRFLTTLKDGQLVYDAGFVGDVVTDEDGNETKTILEEEAQGKVELTEDGKLIWTEKDDPENPHEFVK